MKILLDQNISFKVSRLLADTFPGIKQVTEIGLTDASDLEIWNYARKNNFIIVTFDGDFMDLSNLKGFPPKIIWLRFGNSSNLKIANKLLSNAQLINEFIKDDNKETAFLEID